MRLKWRLLQKKPGISMMVAGLPLRQGGTVNAHTKLQGLMTALSLKVGGC